MSTNKVSSFLIKMLTAAVLVMFMVVMLLVSLKFVVIQLGTSGWSNENVINLMDMIYNNSRLLLLGGLLSLSSLLYLYHLQRPSLNIRYKRRLENVEELKLNNMAKSLSMSTAKEVPVI